jgi:hypothetical protein
MPLASHTCWEAIKRSDELRQGESATLLLTEITFLLCRPILLACTLARPGRGYGSMQIALLLTGFVRPSGAKFEPMEW